MTGNRSAVSLCAVLHPLLGVQAWNDVGVELIAKERDRLLRRTARLVGITMTAIAFLGLGIPGLVDVTSLFAALLLAVPFVFSLARLGSEHSILWVLLGMASGLGIIAIVQLPFAAAESSILAMALVPFAGGAMASFSLVLVGSLPRMAILAVGLLATMGLVTVPTGTLWNGLAGATILGWGLCSFAGAWVSASAPRAAQRIHSIGRAHRAERQASETEAQRRQSARLLHDTVLATLTLLAHSGVGVSPKALRAQAGEDAQLLRQLRLGSGPTPQELASASDPLAVSHSEDAILGTTLESVQQRFDRIGLEVSWHGTGQVLLPSDVLDAFLLALAECLENVRRHAGVTVAHVTITDDDTTVRAMVTDSGTGFDVEDIDAARLGLKDSVIGRLGEVGGTARLFSSPGAGTTVVLEVPK